MRNKNEKIDNERVLKLYALIHESEQHFNQLQSDYRKMASGWLLAVFAGIGFVLKDLSEVDNPYPMLLGALICLAGAIGLFLLWILDLQVYHRLLVANAKAGETMENQYEWLPRIHHNMNTMKKGSVRQKTLTFYLLPIIVLVLFSGIGFAIHFSTCEAIVIISLLHLGLIIGAFWWMKRLEQDT